MKNLNEHISRMKELFIAQHGIIKPLVSEQDEKMKSSTVVQSGVGKDNPDVLFDSSYNESFPVNANQEKKFRAKNPNFDTQLSELKQSPVYKPLVDRLVNDTEMMTIFFFYLNQKTRLQFLTQTLEFLRSFTSERKLEKQMAANQNYTGEENLYNWSANLVAGDVVTNKQNVTKEPTGDFIDVEIPLQVAGKTVYKDNSNEPDVTLIKAIDEWVGNITTEVNNAKSVEPSAVAELVSIDIASSCSRLRNTGSYENMTWNQLSKDRADKVYQIMTERLSSIGVTVSQSVQKILRGGYNGDGSSGPDPARKFAFYTGRTNDMAYSSDGAKRLTGPDENRKTFSYGTLLQTQVESDQYKFCIVIAKIRIKASAEQKEPLKPIVTKSQGYTLELAPLYKEKTKNNNGKLKRMKGAYKGKGGGDNFVARKIPSARAALATCPAYN
jgi:hypothetical protein